MLSCVFQAYDNAMATAISVVDDDGPNGFTIVIQQSKVCYVLLHVVELTGSLFNDMHLSFVMSRPMFGFHEILQND